MVLVKDFETAKQRLAVALRPEERRELARTNAELAILAARAADRVLAVCGSPDAAKLAITLGADVLLEDEPNGQNSAARLGIVHASAAGARAVLLLSSDLPLVTSDAISELLHVGQSLSAPAVVAASAIGRHGTNALYLAPPTAIGLHFGDSSLAKFESEARHRGVVFRVFYSPALALDLDEPSDLRLLEEAG